MSFPRSALAVFIFATAVGTTSVGQETHVYVDAGDRQHKMSPYLTGACIEDVNHEIYGGIYSQQIFGESFQEPSRLSPVAGFEVLGGKWAVRDGVLTGSGGDGPKLIRMGAVVESGSLSVEVRFSDDAPGNGGLLIATTQAGVGADNFCGYEIALNCQENRLVVGRHDHNFQLLANPRCQVEANQWHQLRIEIEPEQFVVYVNDQPVAEVRDEFPLQAGTIGFRQWRRSAEYRNLRLTQGGQTTAIPFHEQASDGEISGMWDAVSSGTANGQYSLVKDRPFVGQQSQRIAFQQGTGTLGLANRGLGRWGMTFQTGKPYEGFLWLRADQPVEIAVRLEDIDSDQHIASQILSVSKNQDWQRVDFSLTPESSTTNGQFVLSLQQTGQVDVGYALLQPGSWGRYKDLPVRRDVVEGLIDQGITVLRYGGSMVDNPPNYRWKNMIGPASRRQPYNGHWYDYSTNGWGIVDFLNLCEAAGFLGIPCFSIDEKPEDMVDFLEYANSGPATPWGSKRASDGHPASYELRHIQLGNEESVNAAYWQRFEPIARALWEHDPGLILIVGDFQFENPIVDPFHFDGSPAGITSLAAHQHILKLAKQLETEVWFDTHMWTGGPDPTPSMNAFFTYVDALEALADGARHEVVVFEFNANNHRQRRALSNAEMILRIMRDGRVPMALSANCLQPDGQNDNGWDQGLLFLDSSKVWLQPPGYITQMIAQTHQNWVVKTELRDSNSGQASETLSGVATMSEDGNSVVLRVVNRSDQNQHLVVHLTGFAPNSTNAKAVALTAPLDGHNTAQSPRQVRPQQSTLPHQLPNKPLAIEIAPYSFTTIQVE